MLCNESLTSLMGLFFFFSFILSCMSHHFGRVKQLNGCPFDPPVNIENTRLDKAETDLYKILEFQSLPVSFLRLQYGLLGLLFDKGH